MNGLIEEQESRGQLSFCNSTDLPVYCGWGGNQDDILLGWGIKLGDPYEDDPIFRPVELPKGWQKKPTSHSMHSDLVDDKGRVRAGIFYKAAFCDRRASLHLNTRFTVRQNYDDYTDPKTHVLTKIQHRVLDGEAVVFTTEAVDTPLEGGKENYKESLAIGDIQEIKCKKWLSENYPEWENPAKYWD